MSTLLDNIKEESKKRGYSLRKLNDLAGLKPNIIYSWANQEPSLTSLKKVADVLHVKVDYLLGRTDEMNDPSSTKKIDLKDTLNDEITLAFDGRPIPEEDKVKIREYIELLDLKRRSGHE
ncbi:helix-turn-helix domain-containing protein [Leuconostoc carnosum]|uniref:helix-turn-helix domain-containing protein n=1 Tax=Leuconostoc carnosum TaxID=1252 RepID=UPI00123B17CF|nr:helix-turn-helix transcriptional regulator [Leuconostoc carnosum]KAA8327824.1 helix-turn-helix transcriptional regulator [Leuconostoc carnosum]KAA8368466.1 helix-turn-helix transcriptional regulator [Leuconostoc carnosum]KAA8369832.1 helix-turn-helix transcriptional regulator [Leuconostoc carnosum]KAA8372390.1 helix-turn-helix transcriptional regulator [Leuconostoc carnosum]KAA8375290.1 helix-turn-helix transcriptional regulator [Leuconostoc carnosum]